MLPASRLGLRQGAELFASWLGGVGDEQIGLFAELTEALLAAVHEDGARVERSNKEVFFVLQVSETFSCMYSAPLRARH